MKPAIFLKKEVENHVTTRESAG